MSNQVFAAGNPTKSFFINMLTRDIDINDAILDLLDNCLDGVVRKRKTDGLKKQASDFYAGYSAKIRITGNSFEIDDNCEGIPLDVAKNNAFRMGRDEDGMKEDVATVGIYGIGMKRAIFKIGKSATVFSKTDNESFSVSIPSNWDKEEEWSFPIRIDEAIEKTEKGTKIIITDLNPGIKQLWEEEGHRGSFVDELIEHIKASYSFIIERGFKVFVNDQEITPNSISFKFSEEIKPFIYTRKIDDVSVRMAVGFYAAPPTIEESDHMAERSTRSTKDAGWTVICNDRVILFNNKDYLTGWGEYGVPKYHTQFIGIRGIVEFESNDPSKLPMTTTKRGVDLASPIYAETKKKMCEGLKLFINFTNNWKGTANSDTQFFSSALDVSFDQLVKKDYEEKSSGLNDTELEMQSQIKMTSTRDGGSQFKPSLPKKPDSSSIKYVRYPVKVEECQKVSNYLFDDEEERVPSVVGEECYKRYLDKALSAMEIR